MSFTSRIKLTGRTALVTGAGSGIGQSCAELLAAQGATHIVLVDINKNALEETIDLLAGSSTALTVAAIDASNWAEVESLVYKVGPIDTIINAAGNLATSPIEDLDLGEWQETIDSHLKSCFVLSRIIVPGMAELGFGRIVNIGSVAGKRGGDTVGFSGTAYAAAKAGIDGLTKVMARELAPLGIRVNGVDPGLTVTKRITALQEDPIVWQKCLESIPLKRPAQPIEIARVVIWLTSDASSYLTGETVNVDGGIAME